MKVRKSSLDGETLVFEIEAGDDGPIVDALDGPKPNGFAIFGEGISVPIAVVDGRIVDRGLTRDHLLAVEAHELGHILQNSEQEEVAERFAIDILTKLGHSTAADILLDRGIV